MDKRALDARLERLNVYDQQVVENLNMLPPKQRKVAALRRGAADGVFHSYNEIAEILGKSPEEVVLMEIGIRRFSRRFFTDCHRRRKLRDFLN